jgi:hypothetical protein
MWRKAAVGVIDELYENALAGLDRTLGALPTEFPPEIAEAIATAVRQRIGLLPSVHQAA